MESIDEFFGFLRLFLMPWVIKWLIVFDTVNRDLLCGILGRLGCPAKFVRIIKKLYTNVRARLVVDGELTSPFEYNSGVKQGCKLAPTHICGCFTPACI